MKDNKINVDLIVPSISKKFNLFIPVNKTIGELIFILNNSINEIVPEFPILNYLSLLDVLENTFYEDNLEIINTKIRNGSILALL